MGISGSGKTTLARELANRFECAHIELDSIHHQPNWTPISDEEFAAALLPRLESPHWVVDGNYSQVTSLVMDRADTVVLLDYSRRLVMCRVVLRTLRRGIRREELWNGNRESLRNLFNPSRDKNIIVWAWSMHGLRHQRNLEYEAQLKQQGRTVFRFENPADTDSWLASI